MPHLIRWQASADSVVTIRCTTVSQHPLLSDHLHLIGVRGANDPEHPDLHVTALVIRQADVVYMCDCVPSEATKPSPASGRKGATEAAGAAAEPPATPEPKQEPSIATQASTRPRRSRAHTSE